MSTNRAGFEIPASFDDDNEFAFLGIPFYVTKQEFGFIAMNMMVVVLIPMLMGMNIILVLSLGLAAACIAGAFVKSQKTKYRAGWPWMWDVAYAISAYTPIHLKPPKRGLMPSSSGLTWLSMHHVPKPALFLTGARKTGTDLTVSSHLIGITPPGTHPAMMVIPRRRRVFSSAPAPAPIWFGHAEGYEEVTDPMLPHTVEWIAVPNHGIGEADGVEVPTK